MFLLATAVATLFSGVIASAITLGFDRWKTDHVRRRDGRAALEEMQRVLGDMSESMLAEDGILERTPLEALTPDDVAIARRSAYPYRDLLLPNDRQYVVKSSIHFDPHSDLPYDNRQIDVNEWAMNLHHAIDRAFAPRSWRALMRRRGQ